MRRFFGNGEDGFLGFGGLLYIIAFALLIQQVGLEALLGFNIAVEYRI